MRFFVLCMFRGDFWINIFVIPIMFHIFCSSRLYWVSKIDEKQLQIETSGDWGRWQIKTHIVTVVDDNKSQNQDRRWWIQIAITTQVRWYLKMLLYNHDDNLLIGYWLVGVFIDTQTFSVPTRSYMTLSSDWSRSVYYSRWTLDG